MNQQREASGNHEKLGAWMDSYPRPIAGYIANLLGSLVDIALGGTGSATLLHRFPGAGMSRRESRPRRRAFYDGAFYAQAFDWQLAPLHRLIAKSVPEGSSLLDVGCGTGAFALHIAPQCREVVGVDISEVMVQWADDRRRDRGFDHVRFTVADASNLAEFDDDTFDLATALMVVHEMDDGLRLQVLAELLRVAKASIVVDYAMPMPRNLQGLRNRLIELSCGPRHFGEFRDFGRRGGLSPLFEELGVTVERQTRLDGGTAHIATVRR